MATANVGRVVQVIGPVVDVEFDKDVPPIYNALQHPGRRAATAACRSTSSPRSQQHLGENRVRCVACSPPTAWCAA